MNKTLIINGVLTSTGHLSRIVSGFVLLKVVSYYLGPEGLGFLGHFMTFMTVLALLSGGGISTSVVKYASEFKNDSIKINGFIGAVFSYALFFCALSFIVLIFFAKDISLFIFKTEDYYLFVYALAIVQVVIAFYNIVNGIVCGLGLLKIYAVIQVVGMLIFLPAVWFLVFNYKLIGAVISVMFLYTSLVIPIIYFLIRERHGFNIYFDSVYIRRLFSFSFMLLVSAITFPVFEVIVREQIIQNHGYADAGIWQGSMRLSSAYMGFFGAFLAFYFMPIISSIADRKTVEALVLRFVFFVFFVFVLGALILYFFKGFFIPLILSDKFDALNDLIIYQLLGDLFRVLSYVIGFVAVAKAATKTYVIAEVLQSVLLIVFIYYSSSTLFNLEGVMHGYALAYAMYFILCAFSFVFYTRFSGRNNAVCS